MAENKSDSTTLVNFRVDAVVKDSAEAVLAGMGLNMSSYVGMCLRKLAQEQGIPFDLRVDPEFWSAEANVSEVMEDIESGVFREAVTAYVEIREKTREEINAAQSKSEHSHWFPFFETYLRMGTLKKEYDSLRKAEEDTGTRELDEWGEVCGNVADYMEARAAEFCESSGISAEDGVEAVFIMNAVLEDAADAYDEHRSHLLMRFANPKADGERLDEIMALSTVRKNDMERNREKERKKAGKRAAEIDAYKKMEEEDE